MSTLLNDFNIIWFAMFTGHVSPAALECDVDRRKIAELPFLPGTSSSCGHVGALRSLITAEGYLRANPSDQ